MKLLTDIYLVAGRALQKEQSDANAYLVDGGDKRVLIDTGGGYNVAAMVEEMGRHGFAPTDIDLIINTHCHFDHTGGNRQLRELGRCRTAIHVSEVEAIEHNTELTVAEIYNHNLTPCPVDIALTGDEVIATGRYDLELMHTPGHTPGCICLLLRQEDKKILFVGDALSLLDLPGENGKQLADSLEKLLAVQADILLSGHDEGLITETAGHIRQYQAKLAAGME
jgi:glyoxylase-like metal-dependent hydrolase (beta-lactamase superfamily II)